jgi:DUF1680 family protein
MDNYSKNKSSRFSRRAFIRDSGLTATGFMLAPNLLINGKNSFSQNSGNDFPYLVNDRLVAADAAAMQGFIGNKLDLSYTNRILAQNVDNLVEPFRHRTETHLWQTEFWGKWFTSAVLAYRYHPTPELKKVLQSAVTGLISTQTPDGYIGNYKAENRLEEWDIWGMKYCMLGLLDYYELTGDKASLDATIKLADYLIKAIDDKDGIIVNKGNYRGMAASSVLGAILRLYTKTNNKKYLDFGEKIVAQWETPGGPQLISKAKVNVSERFPKPKTWYSWEQGQKAYEMMSCYEGLLELYRITGKEGYKTAVEDTWNNIRNTEINIAGSGASVEMWFGGKKRQTSPVAHFQETCVTVTWIRLNQDLFRLTGEAKYAHAIEESYYNALIGALSADGAEWAKYTPLNGQRLPGSGQCGMKLNCCNANGPRGQFTLPFTSVMSMKEGISINFFVEGSYQLKTLTGKRITINQKTDYPVSGNIEFGLDMDAPEAMTIGIRIPSWSIHTELKINGEEIKNIKPGEYAEIKKTWSPNDKISLKLDMHGRLEIEGGDHKYAAILRGPVVLCRDTQLPDTNLGKVITPIQDANGYIQLSSPDSNNKNTWLEYVATFLPESYTEEGPMPIKVSLCDYASAGNGKEPSTFQVWIPQLYDPREA